MPELPEVETVVRALRKPLIGRQFQTVWSDWPKQIGTTAADLEAQIKTHTVESVTRRAKYILVHLSNDQTLIVHLRMTGHLSVVSADSPMDKYNHVVFGLDDNKELRFRDVRKFGTIRLVQDWHSALAHIGPEPLEEAFTPDVLAERLTGRKRAMKPLLLDQTILAGVGNIYADEALFEAKIEPRRPANSLTSTDIINLHAAIRNVLNLGIAREGASIDSYVKPDGQKGDMQNAVMVFRRTELPCYTCGTPISRIVLGGRSTHFCGVCQI